MDQRHTCQDQTKSGNLTCCLLLIANSIHKKLRYQLILSGEIHDQKVLQSDWMGGTTDHTQPKVLVSDATFPDSYLHAKTLRHKLTLYPDTDDQRILQSDWTRGTTSQTQPKLVVSDLTFP